MGAARQLRRYLELIFAEPKRPAASVIPSRNLDWLSESIDVDALAGDGFRSPLIAEARAPRISSPELHVFFLRQCELYRVLELLQRTTPGLVETYSRFRERSQFVDTLQFRYFDTNESILASINPGLVAAQQSLFNQLLELRIFLRYTDALPSHVEKYMNDALLLLLDEWNRLAIRLQAAYGWEFKTL